MTAMQHVCAWKTCAEDERFQVCECELWRWDPVVSDRAAYEASRRVEVAPSATHGITDPQMGGNANRGEVA